ncbi:bidirectional sugar transporter SWEET4-like [Triticum dicoccoides]|uniref:bidirectional sugar transporter SWEET4-like n=1 Tax=Triticum dicoccoides TaxID=85692 RepID=UPI00188F8EE0|nr:bidirectional sugar transporter SWEET4-like [Triticum dicoccoides]
MPSFIVPMPGGRALAAGAGSKAGKAALTGASFLGNTAAALLTIAPVFSFVAPIFREKAVGDRTAYGHIVTLFSSVAMFLYALPGYPGAIVSLIINGVSSLLQLVYVCVFLWFGVGAARRYAFFVLAPVLIASALMICLVATKVIWGSPFVAAVAAGAALLSYFSAIADVVAAAKSKDVANMDPLLEVLLGLVNASASTGFGFFSTPWDLYTAIPNAIGVAILLVQLVVYVMHCNPQPEPEPEPEPEPVHTVDVPNYALDLHALFACPV